MQCYFFKISTSTKELKKLLKVNIDKQMVVSKKDSKKKLNRKNILKINTPW